MPLSAAEQAAIDRLRSYYEGDNPYNSVTNPGGFRQGGHLYNFVPTLKDLAVVIVGAARLATEVAANSVQSPKAVRVDADQGYTAAEKAQGQKNLGLADVLTSFLAKAGGTLTGRLQLSYLNPYILLTQRGPTNAGKGFSILTNDADGLLYIQSFLEDVFQANLLNLSTAGALWTSQMGDVSTRIETRAAAYAAQRLALTGGQLTGDLEILKNYPNIKLTYPNVGSYNINVREWGGLTFWNGGDNTHQFGIDGGIWTKQFGSVNDRIETRGAAYRDSALATARSEDGLRVLKTGDTMTGQLVIKYNYPGLELRASDTAGFPYIDFVNEAAQNVDFCWRLLTYGRSGDGFSFQYQDGSAKFQVSAAGEVITSQLGDLNARIEARGLAYQQAAQGTSVQKSGGTMSGDLQLNANLGSASPGVRFVYPSNADWLIRGIGGDQLQFCDGARSIQYFAFSANGAINTRQFGDLNARIENRGQAFADSAVNRSVSSVRWVYVGDLYNSYNLNNGMAEPYGGSAMTGRATNADGTANGAWIPGIFRWRQLQINIPNQGWVAAYFA